MDVRYAKGMKCKNDLCGTEFTPKRSTAQFCSDLCRVDWNRRQKGAEVDTGPTKPKLKKPKPAKEPDIYDTVAEHREMMGLDPVTCQPKAVTPKPLFKPNKGKNGKMSLDQAIAKINKDYGDGTVVKLTDKFRAEVQVIPTGNLAIDHALGVGGFPKGRIVEIYGPASHGKTTLCLSTIAQCQQGGGRCAFIDVENSFDPKYAESLGVDIATLFFSQPDGGEEALDVCKSLVETGQFDLVVVDSVAMLVPKQQQEGEIGDANIGTQARLMSSTLRVLSPAIRQSNSCVLFTNQLRYKVGAYGNPETTPGGAALGYYATMRLDIRRVSQGEIKGGDGEIIGNRTRVKVVKNKVAPPYKEAEFDLVYGEGIAGPGSVIDLAVRYDILTKRGSWFAYNGAQLAQGREQAKALLKTDTALRAEIEAKVRAAMSQPDAGSHVSQSTEEELPG
jgi:recombination protein RecA